jgi:hypothetical protein
MSDRIENEIARAMRDHDNEAPTAAELVAALHRGSRPTEPQSLGGWRRRYIPLTAAAAVAAVIAGSVWAGARFGGQPAPNTGPALSCPRTYARVAPWVPAGPSGVNARARLVPLRPPSTAVICAYDGSNIGSAAGWALSGRRRLAGGLRALVAQLAWQPARIPGQDIACTLIGGTQVNYLIGLTYRGGGRLWVAATQDPNSCVRSSNGQFVSIGVVGAWVTKAFKAGRWPRPRLVSCHSAGPGVGRLGQDKAMVPPGSMSVTICGRGGRTVTSGFQPLVSALNALPTRVSTRGCSMTTRHGPTYRLLFSYRQGPAVQVNIEGNCVPQVDNLGLQSDSAGTIVPIIERLLR